MPDPAQSSADVIDLLPVAGVVLSVLLRWILLAGESALSAVGEETARELAEERRRGQALLRLKLDPELFAAGLRTGLTLSVVALTASTSLLSAVWANGNPGIAAAAIVASAGAVWFFTSATDPLPRSLAARWPESWALRTAWPLWAVCNALAWPVRAFGVVGNLLLKPFDTPLRFSLPPPPLDDIERLLTQTREEGAPEPALVRSLFDFGERTVKEIMVPRTDVRALPWDAPPEEVVRVFVEEGHTRMPVFQGTLDTIAGIVHVKDVMPLLANPELLILADLVRPATFVPWNRPASRVMRDMQRESQHFAVVVDEYGGVAGIVTLEDVVEELVGDIRDEFDEEPPEVLLVSEDVSLVRGEMRVSQFNELFDAEVPEEEGYETLGGFLASLSGDIPDEGRRFFVGGLELEVARRDPRRVVEVKVSRVLQQESAEE